VRKRTTRKRRSAVEVCGQFAHCARFLRRALSASYQHQLRKEHPTMNRSVVDCRAVPNEVGCTLTIAGQEEEVLAAAVQHAISVHGHTEPIEELRCARSCRTNNRPPRAERTRTPDAVLDELLHPHNVAIVTVR
jgi:predicted small metal-binding protein